MARRAALAVLMLGIGLIHLLDLPGKWEETRWMGVSYLALIAASVAAAELLLRRGDLLAGGFAAGVAAGPIAGFVLTRTTGLPGAMDDIGNWGEPLGLSSLFVETVALVLIGASFADSATAGQPAPGTTPAETTMTGTTGSIPAGQSLPTPRRAQREAERAAAQHSR